MIDHTFEQIHSVTISWKVTTVPKNFSKWLWIILDLLYLFKPIICERQRLVHVLNSLFFSIDPVILVFVYLLYESTIKFDEVSLVSFNLLTNLSQRIWSFLQLVADTWTLCKKLLWWTQPSISIITSVKICLKTSMSFKLLYNHIV